MSHVIGDLENQDYDDLLRSEQTVDDGSWIDSCFDFDGSFSSVNQSPVSQPLHGSTPSDLATNNNTPSSSSPRLLPTYSGPNSAPFRRIPDYVLHQLPSSPPSTPYPATSSSTSSSELCGSTTSLSVSSSSISSSLSSSSSGRAPVSEAQKTVYSLIANSGILDVINPTWVYNGTLLAHAIPLPQDLCDELPGEWVLIPLVYVVWKLFESDLSDKIPHGLALSEGVDHVLRAYRKVLLRSSALVVSTLYPETIQKLSPYMKPPAVSQWMPSSVKQRQNARTRWICIPAIQMRQCHSF